MGAVRTVAPTVEPVSLAEVKLHLRETGTDQDALITSQITAAREHVERITGVRCNTQTWLLTQAAFPSGAIVLPGHPLLNIVSIQYLDTAGALQTLPLSGLVVDTSTRPGRVSNPVPWPATRTAPNAVRVEYRVGFGPAAADVPADIKSALFLMVGDMFENRQGQQRETLAANPAVDALLWPHRWLTP